jgi:hypothetical protein
VREVGVSGGKSEAEEKVLTVQEAGDRGDHGEEDCYPGILASASTSFWPTLCQDERYGKREVLQMIKHCCPVSLRTRQGEDGTY